MQRKALPLITLILTASCLPGTAQPQQASTLTPRMVQESTATVEPEVGFRYTETLAAIIEEIIETELADSTMEIITPPADYEEKIQSLLDEQERSDCRLPCWWGIVPGETTWDDEALNLLRTISGNISYYSYGDLLIASVTSPPLLPTNATIRTSYEIKENVVTLIEVSRDEFGTTSRYTLEYVSAEFGAPDEIWLGPWEIDQEFVFPYWLYYAEKGILLPYGGGSGTMDNGKLVMCFENPRIPALILLPENDGKSFADLTQSLHLFSPPPVDPESYRLFSDISNLSNKGFVSLALNESPENCFVANLSDLQ